MNENSVVVCSGYYNDFQRQKQILLVSQSVQEAPYSNLCSEQVSREEPSFISFSHPLPRAICRALMGCRNIITALMHTLKLSSFDLISSVFQDSKCFWREDLHTETFICRCWNVFSALWIFELSLYSPACYDTSDHFFYCNSALYLWKLTRSLMNLIIVTIHHLNASQNLFLL